MTSSPSSGVASWRRPSPRVVAGLCLAAVLLAWVVSNRDDVRVSFLVASVTMPLWLALTVAAVLGAGAGALLGRRRGRR